MNFKLLFGCDAAEIQSTCVIAPFLPKGFTTSLGITKMAKGRPYATGQGKGFSLIHTHIGTLPVGDAVLYLKNTSCEKLLLIGACGLVTKTDDLDIGILVTLTASYALESFTQLLNHDLDAIETQEADTHFVQQLQEHKTIDVQPVIGATFGSIKLEEDYVNYLKGNDINVVDLECSAFFAAGKHINRQAAALLYITDILKEHHVFAPMDKKTQNKITAAQEQQCELIKHTVN